MASDRPIRYGALLFFFQAEDGIRDYKVTGVQTCALPIFIVVERVADRFLERFTAEMRARRVGDPLDPSTQIGPQARLDLRANLHRQVEESARRGAQGVLGGQLPKEPGPGGGFYPPTLLVAVEPGMPAFDEETFGP